MSQFGITCPKVGQIAWIIKLNTFTINYGPDILLFTYICCLFLVVLLLIGPLFACIMQLFDLS